MKRTLISFSLKYPWKLGRLSNLQMGASLKYKENDYKFGGVWVTTMANMEALSCRSPGTG